jgi:hypothetical protein
MQKNNRTNYRRIFRATFGEKVASSLQTFCLRNKISQTYFAKLVTDLKLVDMQFNSCCASLSNLLNGKYPSDRFCISILNSLSVLDGKIKQSPKFLKPYQKAPFRISTGRAMESFDSFLSKDKNDKGLLSARRVLRKTSK